MTFTSTTLRERVVAGFETSFGGRPSIIASAPGRVNIIGEHTDYHQGLVMPMAISLRTMVALQRTGDDRCEVVSESFDEVARFNLNDLNPETPVKGWAAYVAGVAWALQQAGHRLPGVRMYIAGDVPRGAGLSSSAAIEVAAAFGWLAAVNAAPQSTGERKATALLCQKAESAYVGMPCGIMDQMISACGEAGTALMIDCRDVSLRHVTLHPDITVVVCDTGVKHQLASSGYADRRRESEAALAEIRKHHPGLSSLRDATMGQVDEILHNGVDAAAADILYRRARHVVKEIQRVQWSMEALPRGDTAELGEILAAGHDSLRMDYEVSCGELDAMVAVAAGAPGCIGGRMTGGGFGGSTVNLVERRLGDAFIAHMKAADPAPAGIWEFQPGDGARVEVV